ncbi:MAG TPA: hypothetical protein VKH44_11600 [Pirellulaceae bacterium]|nr:hypothetical protein [Pirellulaceae bacterium]
MSRRWLAVLLTLALAAPAAAQSTQPVWWPPMSLYGRPVAQPYFEFPTWARYSYCRPAPLAWGYDPFPNYGPCDNAPGGPSINCPGNFVAHRPSGWYFSSNFAPTTVDFQNTRALAELGTNGPVVLSTSDLQPNFDAGTHVTIGRRIFDCYRLEATYWGSFQWKDYAAVADNTGVGGTGTLSTLLSGGFGNAAVAALDNNTFVSAESRTKMNNGELNLLYWIDMPPGGLDVSLLVGGRYLDVRDQFNLGSINPVQENRLQVNTINEMWFIQTGIATDWLIATRMWINGTLKGGLANNHATLANNYTTTAAGVTTVNPTTATQNRTAGLLDLSLVANFQVTPWLVGRIGYQALFVSGVAVATDNIQTNNVLLTNGPAQVDARSNAIFHGPLIGIMGNW